MIQNMIKRNLLGSIFIGALALNWACSNSSERAQNSQKNEKEDMKVIKTDFGSLEDGTPVDLYTLTNENGVEVKITNYGGIITSLKVPDKQGKKEDVVLGFESLEGYLQEGVPYFGAIVGRYGNRIAEGTFTLDGEEYNLAINNGPNHLHGGLVGFDKVLWQAEEVETENTVGVKVHYLSKDMEEGYPGNLSVEVIYTLNKDNELAIEYKATTDKKTIVNLTNHSYFNLTGNMKRDILAHEVMINADRFVPVDSTLIPTGELLKVEGTPFDFTEPTAVGKRIDAVDQQVAYGLGYDHCWVLNGEEGEMKLAASVYEPNSGRYMEVKTTEPGIQFYSGNFLDGSLSGKGVSYDHRYGLCLETEHFPDSPNQPSFPSVVLEPGDTYQTKTIYAFSVR